MFASNAVAAAFKDMAEGVALAPLWSRLVLEQTIARYRRTLLGPFWLASSTLATAFGLSIVFGSIFQQAWRENFPFILSGVVCFGLASGVVAEGAGTFLTASGIMQTRRFPLTFHSLLLIDRVMINFAHQLVAFWIVTAVLGMFPLPHWQLILSLPLVMLIGVFLSIPLGMVSARYRDVGYMIGFVVQALFMLTPVFWHRAQMTPHLRWIVDYNPIAHMLEIVRQPLLGHPGPPEDWVATFMFLIFSVLLGVGSLILFRRRVVFWL
jgi:ABC-type polysaccharide/polyol phosphate export permease